MSIDKLSMSSNQGLITDLLFSSKIGFVWDDEGSLISWINAATRSKLNLNATELTTSLLKKSIQTLACQSKSVPSPRTFVLKLKKGCSLICMCEPLQLANGHRGLIVSETQADVSEQSRSVKSSKRATAALKPKKATPKKKPSSKANVIVADNGFILSQAEQRSLKAIGRKVKKLAEKKRRVICTDHDVKPIHPVTLAMPLPAKEKIDCQSIKFLVPAFDLFILFDKEGCIIKLDGRLQRFGWRKSNINGQSISKLFAESEKWSVDRMTAKIFHLQTNIVKDTLLLENADGTLTYVKAVFGSWPEDENTFYAALTVLSISSRLKRLRSRFDHINEQDLLAA